jgi:predicted RNase H-related nuclease YkuK (DUF458 family)
LLSTKKWRWPNGEAVSEGDLTSILSDKSFEIYVGSDSHILGGHCVFATVVAAWRPGQGGRFFYTRDTSKASNFFHLQKRLTEEAFRSIDVASEIRDSYGREAEVHLDLNTERYRSSKYTKELTAIVEGHGFKCQVKPEAWVSSTLADKSAR